MTKSDNEEITLFFKYGIFIPIILTLFLEILQFSKVINIEWLWVLSPIWIWLGGCFQFLLGGILVEMLDKKDKK